MKYTFIERRLDSSRDIISANLQVPTKGIPEQRQLDSFFGSIAMLLNNLNACWNNDVSITNKHEAEVTPLTLDAARAHQVAVS